MSAPRDPKHDEIHPAARPFLWLESARSRALPMYIFGGLALLLLVWEFFNPRHGYAKFEELFGFYEIEGFFGFCLAVLAGWPLRKLLARPADYYTPKEEREQEDDNV